MAAPVVWRRKGAVGGFTYRASFQQASPTPVPLAPSERQGCCQCADP